MIADAARTIGGKRARVTGLMGPGVDPHLYQASRGDQRRILDADLVLYHGLQLEGRMADFLRELGERPRPGRLVAAAGEAIPRERLLFNPLIPDYPDPHVWFDLELWKIVATAVGNAFAERDPEHAAEYGERAAEYSAELDRWHRWALEQAQKLPPERRKIVTSHDAYNYFARAYGFEVHGLQGISTVTPAGLKDIEAAVHFIREYRIPVIFAETSVSPAAVERVAKSAGAKVSARKLYSDALGPPGGEEGTLLGVFRYNLRAMVEELSQEAVAAQ
jgi:manganese/zinc/iron transport system substrate-binding protein